MSGGKHNPNVELVAQGVANVFSPLFGGLPATGAIARTATNIRSGAKTPVAGMIHALTLLAIVLFAAPLARFIPLAGAGRDSFCGFLQHGRMERDSGIAEAVASRNRDMGSYVSIDRVRRSDRCGGGRDDTRRACVHPQGYVYNDCFAGDGGICSRRLRAHVTA